MNNEELVCMEVHAKHDLIKIGHLKQYISEKTGLKKDEKKLTDKVVMTHRAIGAIIPEDLFKYIKTFVFTHGSRVQKELIRIKRMNYYKMKSLTIDRIDELIIHQNIQWEEIEDKLEKEEKKEKME
jgi:hypothetical protein